MSFLWPSMLWLLLALPLLVGLYVWLLRRRKKAVLRYANLALVKEAIGAGQRWRRHVPPALFLLALAAMLVAVARPTAVVTLPSQHDTVVLAMDVSRSMLAEDVQPNRITAAQAAARAFIADQPPQTRIAIVAFAGTASVVQAPTNSREDLLAAIDRFQLQRATAIGNAIIVSLATIFPEAKIDIAAVNATRRGGGIPLDPNPSPNAPAFKPVPPGSYTGAVIILLTDGQATTGVDPIDAARMAADRGVRVFTVGIGTKEGEILRTEGWSMRVRLDEESLKTIANLTRGEYFYAGTAVDLKKVYETLNAKLVMETRQTEVTALF
ncbi:MAG TPA: VWA domain-containing protein, partial [Burkholderiaceae bacterium]|nr:VWA domain-containing protein [Burkholderiaceae bacterium]